MINSQMRNEGREDGKIGRKRKQKMNEQSKAGRTTLTGHANADRRGDAMLIRKQARVSKA